MKQPITASTAVDPQEEEASVQEDDWGLACEFHLFAQHEAHPVYITKTTIDENGAEGTNTTLEQLQVLCVESLTPLDMMHLGSGIHDATGHCVWTGAFLFLHCLERLRPKYLQQKCVLELGCGTGLAGMAVCQYANPKFVRMTDADPEALDLCRQNCTLNQLDPHRYAIQALTWGQAPQLPSSTHKEEQQQQVDTILATDVLYDIGMLTPILETARLSDCQYFLLAHVPRACYNSKHPPCDNLEDYIVKQFESFAFCLHQTLRPMDMMPQQQPFPKDALNHMSLQEMQEVGATVMVFSKTDNNNQDAIHG